MIFSFFFFFFFFFFFSYFTEKTGLDISCKFLRLEIICMEYQNLFFFCFFLFFFFFVVVVLEKYENFFKLSSFENLYPNAKR